MEALIIKYLIDNIDYFRKTILFLEKNHFKNSKYNILFDIIKNYYIKYKKQPSYKVIVFEVNDLEIENDKKEDILKIVSELQKKEFEDNDLQYFLDRTEKYVRNVVLKDTMLDSLSIMEQDDEQKKQTIPKKLQDALSLKIEKNLGHDYIEDAQKRFDFYNEECEQIKTHIKVFNDMLNGGFPKQTFSVVMASINIGKTLILEDLAASFFEHGKNVLYFTLEVSEMRISERVDQNILNSNNDDLRKFSNDDFMKKINKIKDKTKGRLKVIKFPAGRATVNDVENVINELYATDNFSPDIIFIDYITLMRSVALTKLNDLFIFGKVLSEEIRGLATILNLPIVGACQTNRSGFKKTSLDMDDVGTSWAIMETADFSWTVTQTDEMAEQDKYLFKRIKTRFSPLKKGIIQAFVGVDVEKQKLYNLDDPFEGLNMNKLKDDDNQIEFKEINVEKYNNLKEKIDYSDIMN